MLRQVKSILLLVTILSIACTVLVINLSHHDPPPDPYAFDKATLLWQQQQLEATRSEQSAETMHAITEDAVPFGYALLKLALLCLFSGCAIVAMDQYIQRRKILIYPQAGYYPAPRSIVVQSARLAEESMRLRADVDRIAALMPPRILHNHTEPFTGPQFPEVVNGKVVPIAQPVPTFSEMLRTGIAGLGKPFVLAYRKKDGQPIQGSLKSTYSCAVTGMPGSGKTTTQRFIILQAALSGAKFVLCDPHANVEESSLAAAMQPLSSLFLHPVTTESEDILAAVKKVHGLMHKRLNAKWQEQNGVKVKPWNYPIILIIDEWNSLVDSEYGEELSLLVSQIAKEGRKTEIFAFISGQIWNAEGSGGTKLRYALSSRFVHRQERASARLLISTDDSQKAEKLADGEVLLRTTSGITEEGTIPNTTDVDVKTVANLLGLLNTDPRHKVTLPTATARYSGPVAMEVASSSVPVAVSDVKPSQEELDVFNDFMSGKNPSLIATERYGMASKGDAYMKKVLWLYDAFRKVAKYYGLPDTVHISTAPVDNDILVE